VALERFSGVPVGRFSGAAGAQAVSRASKIISVSRFSMANFLPNKGILSPAVAQISDLRHKSRRA